MHYEPQPVRQIRLPLVKSVFKMAANEFNRWRKWLTTNCSADHTVQCVVRCSQLEPNDVLLSMRMTWSGKQAVLSSAQPPSIHLALNVSPEGYSVEKLEPGDRHHIARTLEEEYYYNHPSAIDGGPYDIYVYEESVRVFIQESKRTQAWVRCAWQRRQRREIRERAPEMKDALHKKGKSPPVKREHVEVMRATSRPAKTWMLLQLTFHGGGHFQSITLDDVLVHSRSLQPIVEELDKLVEDRVEDILGRKDARRWDVRTGRTKRRRTDEEEVVE